MKRPIVSGVLHLSFPRTVSLSSLIYVFHGLPLWQQYKRRKNEINVRRVGWVVDKTREREGTTKRDGAAVKPVRMQIKPRTARSSLVY